MYDMGTPACGGPAHYSYGYTLSAAPAVLEVTCVLSTNSGDSEARVTFHHPLAASQHAALKGRHRRDAGGSGKVHSRSPSGTEPVEPCKPPEKNTHGGSPQPSLFTVSWVR